MRIQDATRTFKQVGARFIFLNNKNFQFKNSNKRRPNRMADFSFVCANPIVETICSHFERKRGKKIMLLWRWWWWFYVLTVTPIRLLYINHKSKFHSCCCCCCSTIIHGHRNAVWCEWTKHTHTLSTHTLTQAFHSFSSNNKMLNLIRWIGFRHFSFSNSNRNNFSWVEVAEPTYGQYERRPHWLFGCTITFDQFDKIQTKCQEETKRVESRKKTRK